LRLAAMVAVVLAAVAVADGRLSFRERNRLHKAFKLNYFERQTRNAEDTISRLGMCGSMRFKPRGEYREQIDSYKAHTRKLQNKIGELCIAAREDDTEETSAESESESAESTTEATSSESTDSTSSESTDSTSTESTEATSSESTEATSSESTEAASTESTEATSSESTESPP